MTIRCGKSSLKAPPTAWGTEHERYTYHRLAALAASFALSACGGAGAPTTANVAPRRRHGGRLHRTSGGDRRRHGLPGEFLEQRPRPEPLRSVPQRHLAGTDAEFARSDDVNLAYAQANTVVNLATPSTSLIVTKVSGGHNCWLADNSACGQILTTWIANWAGAAGAGVRDHGAVAGPAGSDCRTELEFPGRFPATISTTV